LHLRHIFAYPDLRRIEGEQMTNVLCGPSNFAHPRWERSLLPGPRRRGFHPLELIATHFDAVEIGSSFEEDLKPEITGVWAGKTTANSRFAFTVKLHCRFTHERLLDEAGVKVFKEGVWPLLRAGKLGCLLMQFPWSFRYTAENRAHLIRLRRAFHEFPLVAEMRHASWIFDEAVGTFIDYRIGFCNIDQPVYTKAMPPTAFLTSSIGYVRLHGRNCFNWYGAAEHPSRAPRYDYAYTRGELADWVRRIDHIRNYATRVFVIANNGVDGKAIATATQMRALVSGREPVMRRAPGSQTPLFTEFHSRAVA
jgi:uncharacterized protein YecE (DUF72 family)